MSARGRSADSDARGTEAPPERGHGVALGFLALVPLLVLYELTYDPTGARNLAEVLCTLPFTVLGEHATLARRLALLGLTTMAAWRVFHAELGLAPRILRIALEGLVAAAVLGPLLLVLLSFLGGLELLRDVRIPEAPEGPGLARAAVLAGGAAWEELVFRFGLLALFVLLLRPVLEWWLGSARPARLLAETGAVLGSALFFAAAHLAVFTSPFGPGGEVFHPGVFPWRVLAGILLALLFRFRGLGVAAWAHAFFNLALAIGAGPGVFL